MTPVASGHPARPGNTPGGIRRPHPDRACRAGRAVGEAGAPLRSLARHSETWCKPNPLRIADTHTRRVERSFASGFEEKALGGGANPSRSAPSCRCSHTRRSILGGFGGRPVGPCVSRTGMRYGTGFRERATSISDVSRRRVV